MSDTKRRSSDILSLQTLDLRVTALEDGVQSIRHDMADAVREIQANTALTEEIHGATADLREVISDLKVFIKWAKRGWKPFLAVCGFFGAVVVYIKTGEWLWPK